MTRRTDHLGNDHDLDSDDDLADLDYEEYLDELDRLHDLEEDDDFDDFDEDDCEYQTWGTDPLFVDPDPAADERLRQMMERIEAAIPAEAPTLWIRVLAAPTPAAPAAATPQPPATPAEPAAIEVDPDLPALMGYVAPPSCIALAIVGGGRAHRWEPPAPHTDHTDHTRRPDPATSTATADQPPIDVPPEGMRITTVCLMDRAGRMAGHTRFADGSEIPTPPESGRLVDALRRAFALPTVRPQFPATELVSRFWLANVLAAADDRAAPLNWKRVRELHPSAKVLKDVGEPLTGPALDRARRVSAAAWTWSRLRYQAIEGDWLPEIVDSKLAAWMDEGMFSRWVLDDTLPTGELLRLATPCVAPSVRGKLAREVGA